MLITIDEHGSKIARTSVFFFAICRQSDLWQSETLFLTNFGLLLSIVFSVAAYRVWFRCMLHGGHFCIQTNKIIWNNLC